MNYLSTRGGAPVSAAQAIVQGICPSGGLYVPASFPLLSVESLLQQNAGYLETAYAVMSRYLPETDGEQLKTMIQSAYQSFDSALVAPLVPLGDDESVLELWHGPTMAFKDIALQMLPYLLRNSLLLTGENKEIYILVATSGDTGKAALSGFCDVPGTRVLVFYPYGGVSQAQRLQMVTQEGNNVDVCAVRGNFDDAQTGVKAIFASEEMKQQLATEGFRLSSANSINFGRLLPQIVYYFSSYLDLRRRGTIRAGEAINFCVPTGNFGDILAGYYAKKMGLPIHKLILASNRNNVLADFFDTGKYDARRPFYKSMSCSIDILISSNLERLLFEISGRDACSVQAWMASLKCSGAYDIQNAPGRAILDDFASGWCSEEDTLQTIRQVYQTTGYLMDPHTAVAETVYGRYREATGDRTHCVVLSTANPYKFATDVLGALETCGKDDFQNVQRLNELTGMPVPKGISELTGKKERHLDVCDIKNMPQRVLSPVTIR